MHVYVIYDRATGEVVETFTKYVLGNDEPVACTEEEVLAAVEGDAPGRELAVAAAPEGFRPSLSGQRLAVRKGAVVVEPARRTPPARRRSGTRRAAE